MPTAHLVHGFLAVGKTRFARDLAQERNAVLISIDEWYLRLYTDGVPTPHLDGGSWARLWTLLDDHWPQILRAGSDVVLDLGFWRREDRDRARTLATDVGAGHATYWVRTDDATARARFTARNAQPDSSFLIDEAGYDEMKDRYDAPTIDERVEIVWT